MLQVILNNLLYISIAFGILIVSVLAKIFAKTFYNISTLKEKFDINKFLIGFLKMLAIGISTALLAIVVTLVPYLLQMAGLNIPSNVEDVINVGAVILLYFNGIKKYSVEAYDTVKDILENKNLDE